MKKIIIVGPSGSGKNYLMEGLITNGLKPFVKTTTRPKRKGEIDKKDYYFIDKKDFLKIKEDGNFITYQSFNIVSSEGKSDIWYYGILKEEFLNSDIIIMTPGELSDIPLCYRTKSLVIYLNPDKNIIKERLVSRFDNNDSIERRMESDIKDFNNFSDYDLEIKDAFFDIDNIEKKINIFNI